MFNSENLLYKLSWSQSDNANWIKGSVHTRNFEQIVLYVNTLQVDRTIVVKFPVYHLSIHKWMDGSSELNEFTADIQDLIKFYDLTQDYMVSISKIIDKHIRKHNRIVDSDMSTYICYMILIIDAIWQEKGQRVQPDEAMEILKNCVRYIENEYPEFIVMTGISQTQFGIQPFPIPYKDFLEEMGIEHIQV